MQREAQTLAMREAMNQRPDFIIIDDPIRPPTLTGRIRNALLGPPQKTDDKSEEKT
jgi:hypothetical protein